MGYEGSRTIYGAWLMDEASLQSLEELANKIYEYIDSYQQDENIEKIEDTYERYSVQKDKEKSFKPRITVKFVDGTNVKKNSFQDLFDLLEVRDKVPNKIVVELNCYGITVNLTLYSKDLNTSYFQYDVTGYIKHENYDEIKTKVIGKIENWIDDNRPNSFFRIWWNAARWSAAIFFLVIALFGITSYISASNKIEYTNNYTNEVSNILDAGVDDSNRDRALELVLMKEYNYVPASLMEAHNQATYRYYIIYGIVALMALFIRICPKSNYAIGKGKQRVKRWQEYKKVVYVVIPSWILIPIFISLVF